jgi:hypothetical protein
MSFTGRRSRAVPAAGSVFWTPDDESGDESLLFRGDARWEAGRLWLDEDPSDPWPMLEGSIALDDADWSTLTEVSPETAFALQPWLSGVDFTVNVPHRPPIPGDW